ncbi:MAG: 1-deoxy-D-xylulose-5-phosphate reductoisomerase [Longimicrobiales bacterium]
MAGVSILGATGSIGRSALAVVSRHAERFRVVALTANHRRAELLAQVRRFQPEMAVLAEAWPEEAGNGAGATRWRHGRAGLLEAAEHPEADVVLNAVVGAAGLEASLAALRAGKRLALANKESLVVGGRLVIEAMRQGAGELVPVDSEHSAILQCLERSSPDSVRRLILTASGGPFRDRDRKGLASVTPAEALRHPTWDMGAKITIDSATLVNKALEVIEAHHLFGVSFERIEVVIHPQSIVHSMVEFADGSVLAQLSPPSMELPILYALGYPDRIPDEATRYDPVATGPLSFERLDVDRFPAFRLGIAAGASGGSAPAVFNAANEEAVAAFLDGRLTFLGIADVIAGVLDAVDAGPADTLEAVLAADGRARAEAHRRIGQAC